jgi:Undecaprenyl-phosphate glucose phosphotransferase
MLLQLVPPARPDVGRAPDQAGTPSIKTYNRLPLHKWVAGLVIGDLLGSLLLAGLTFGIYSVPRQYAQEQFWTGAGGFLLLWGLAAHSQQLYRRPTMLGSLRQQLLRCACSVALAFGLILLLAFSVRMIGGFSRIWLAAWSAGALIWMGALRLAWRHHLRILLSRGWCLDRAVMITGSSEAGRTIRKDIEMETLGEVRFVATAAFPGTPGGSSLDWVEDAVRTGQVDRVFISCFERAFTEANALLTRLARLAVEVTVIPSLEGIEAPVLRVDNIGMRAVVDVNLLPLSAPHALVKRAEDLVVASVALILFLPVFSLIALAIKLDSPGPVFFRQWRAGFHDHPFRLWKFRTMHHNLRDEHAARQTSRNDNRVTRVGRFLRRTSLDEIPQFINVILGEMSVVGPRPHALGTMATGQLLHEAMSDYSSRHRVKPGITGWAQVCGCRGELDSYNKLRRRVAYDCFYIENWSLGFDLWIILRTAAALFFDNNAY